MYFLWQKNKKQTATKRKSAIDEMHECFERQSSRQYSEMAEKNDKGGKL